MPDGHFPPTGALFGVHGVTTLKKYLTTPALLETPVHDRCPWFEYLHPMDQQRHCKFRFYFPLC
jgi:hypothetical protein